MEFKEGQTATNPKTGQKIMFKGGQWVSAGAAGPSRTVDPKAAARVANLKALENQITRVRQLYAKGPGATRGLMGIQDYLPTPTNRQFDSAGAGLGELGLAAFRVPGVGAQSDAELRAFVEANRPSARDYDVQIQEKLNNLQNRLGTTYQALGIPYKPPSQKTSAGGWSIEEVQ